MTTNTAFKHVCFRPQRQHTHVKISAHIQYTFMFMLCVSSNIILAMQYFLLDGSCSVDYTIHMHILFLGGKSLQTADSSHLGCV